MTQVLIGLLSGIAFGFVIQRAGATNADKMARAHLMMEPFIPQFMLLTVALAAVGLFALQGVGVGRTNPLPTSLVATSLAAVIFGAGWGLTGYCPGTTWAAVGEGRMDAVFALLGGLAGTAAFAQFHEVLVPALYLPTNLGPLTLPGLLGSAWLALGLEVAVLAGAVLLIGRLFHRDQPF